LPTAGGVCFSEAIATVTIDCVPAEGCDYHGVALAIPIHRSTMMEGTSCSFTVSSPTIFRPFTWHALGSGN
jgi:Na+/H+-dicarboxylate symporter